jgi:hypothetical protein
MAGVQKVLIKKKITQTLKLLYAQILFSHKIKWMIKENIFSNSLHFAALQNLILGRLILWKAFEWAHNVTCWDNVHSIQLNLWVWAQLYYINHSNLYYFSDVGCTLFTLTCVNSTISPSHVIPSHHITTLSLNFFVNFMCRRL